MAGHPYHLSLLENSEEQHTLVKRYLLQFIATGSLSFNLCNNPEFRQFVASLDPQFVVPDRRTLSTTVLDFEYQAVIDYINAHVREQEVAISFDHWSSKNNAHSLMGCTVDLISPDWERHLLVLSLEEVDGAHNSEQVFCFSLCHSFIYIIIFRFLCIYLTSSLDSV